MGPSRLVPAFALLSVAALALNAGGCSSAEAFSQASSASEGGRYSLISLSDGSVRILRDSRPYLTLGLAAWGANWSWAGWEQEGGSPQPGSIKGRFRLNNGANLAISMTASNEGKDITVTFSADRDTDLTLAALTIASPGFSGGSLQAGQGTQLPLPLGINDFGPQVKKLSWTKGSEAATLEFVNPVRATSDGAVRVILAEGRAKAGAPVTLKAKLGLPGPAKALDPTSAGDEMRNWYPFKPEETDPARADELSAASFLDAPAGRKGRITSQGDQLLAAGQPIKLWGINLCYSDCAPPKELAERRADFYARHGINAVRLHKYADGPGWAGIQGPGSFASFDSEAADRMDYFVAKLKAKGIYVKLSPTFGVKLGPDDATSVPFIREFGSLPSPGNRLETRHGSVFLSREIQDLQIQQMVSFLKRKNPYTGLTYAEDPAIAIVEAYNEDSALFYGVMDRLQNVPTLRRRAGAAFFTWLKAKYATKAGLTQAWGEGGLNTFAGEGFSDESWEEGRIYPVGNPWFFDPQQLSGSQKGRKQRLLDAMAWLYEQQNSFYDRWKKEVRAAGYQGELLASNWIAGQGPSHYLNLHSDYRIGMVDRHNYFGGSDGPLIFDQMMLEAPGSGILSSGASQALGRPFSMSEWIHVFPNEWGAEGPALIGAYGMGLQGWDVSFIFQNRDEGRHSDRIGRDLWDAVAPQVIGLFPSVARQVHRGDVSESSLSFTRRVHVPSLKKGILGFDDQAAAQGDIKTTDSSDIPARSLAKGRLLVAFTDQQEKTVPAEVNSQGVIESSTGQLRWQPVETEGGPAWFTLDTPGGIAYVGRGKKEAAVLKNGTIQPSQGFAAIYATAQGRSETLASAKGILITAISRARNTGMKIVGSLLLEPGKGPILMEPVKARLKLPSTGDRNGKLILLDHAGRRTGVERPIVEGWVDIDTGRDKTPFYLVER
jgi:hypothetical protein